jgi:hypothetical protein
VALGAVLVIATNLAGHAEPTHDERVNVTMAQNILDGFEGLVHPSVTRGVPTDWQREALPELGNTPMFPLLLAGFGQLGSFGMQLLPGLIFAAFLAACFAAVHPLDRASASATALLAASAPWVVKQFAMLEFEPLVATCCATGFALLVRSEGPQRLLLACLSGLATGLGFATKMWLVLPGVLACLAYFVARAYEGGQVERARWARAFVTFTLGFAAGAASHLGFVAVTAGEDLQAWVDSVYLGIFSGHGASGPKLSELGNGSPWDYARWLMRDHAALLGPIALGLPAFTRRMGVSRRAFSAAVFASLLALIPLSIPAAKEPLYMAPVLPFVYAFAALCLIAPDRTPRPYLRVNRGAARFALSVAALVILGNLLSALVEGERAWLELGARLSHACIWSVPSFRVLRGKDVGPSVVPCALGSFVISVLLTSLGPRGLLP